MFSMEYIIMARLKATQKIMEFLPWYQYWGWLTQPGVVGAGLPKAGSSEPAPTKSVGVNQQLHCYHG